MKKIWIDGYEANVPQRLGSSQVGFELLKNIEMLDQVNDYTIVLPHDPIQGLPQERDKWRYKVLRPSKLWTRIALPIFIFRARQKPDIFFSPTHYAPRFINRKIKKIITIFDLAYLHYPTFFNKTDLYKLKNWTKTSIESAAHILTISKSSKNDLVNLLKVNPEKIIVAYPGYDSSNYRIIKDRNSVEEIKEKYGISGRYVVFLGTVQPRKNLIRLIEAVARIEDIKLVVIGKASAGKGRQAWKYEETLNKPKELGIEDRVIFTGFVETPDIPFLFSGAECFVLPSLYEGFGITVLEAMACGTPVIVSNVSSLPEVVGDAGLLIDPKSSTQIEQAIRTIMTDTKLRDKIITLGLEQVKKFSWERMAKSLIKIFEEI